MLSHCVINASFPGHIGACILDHKCSAIERKQQVFFCCWFLLVFVGFFNIRLVLFVTLE